tara:strand:- start:73 stop:468 length:396 start_codon:yes stop_codon:yes gene_type:complete
MFVLRPDTESEMVIGFDVGYYAPNGVFVMLVTFVDYSPQEGSDRPERARVAEAFKAAAALVSVLNGGDVSAMPLLNAAGQHGVRAGIIEEWDCHRGSVRAGIIEEWDCHRGMMPDGLGQFGAKVPNRKVVR